MSTEVNRPKPYAMGGLRIGRIAGIDIIVHWSWLVIFGLLTWSLAETLFLHDYPSWTRGVAWIAAAITSIVVFASVLLHELSHSIMARRQGMNVSSITLFIFGGVSALTEEPKGPRQEFFIAAAGPVSSFLLAGLFALEGLVFKGGIGTASFYLAFINAVLGAFNLLPGFPLDGGRVLRALAWARYKNFLRATRIATLSGTAVAYALMVGGVLLFFFSGFVSGLWFILIGWFLLSQTRAAYGQVVARNILRDARVSAVATRDYHPVPPDLDLDSFVSDYVLAFHERSYPVVRDHGLEGLITLVDLKKYPREQWYQHRVSDVMTPRDRLHTTSPSDRLSEVAERLAHGDVHQLPVVSDGEFVGFVTRADVVRLIQTRSELMTVEAPGSSAGPEGDGRVAGEGSSLAPPGRRSVANSARGSLS